MWVCRCGEEVWCECVGVVRRCDVGVYYVYVLNMNICSSVRVWYILCVMLCLIRHLVLCLMVCLQVETVVSGMSVSLLVRHPDTGSLHVNFDQSIHQLLKETEQFQRLGLEVPPLALRFFERSDAITTNYSSVKVCVCVCACVRACVRAYMCACVRAYVRTCMHAYVCVCVYILVHLWR